MPVFPGVVPSVLSDPAQWQRIVRLRDRVESQVDALATVREVLAPVEQELWAEADAIDANGTPATTRFAADATRRVDAALTTLGV